MLRFHLPPNLVAAAARNAIPVRVEIDLATAPTPNLLPALALLQRWCGPKPPAFLQLTRAQLRAKVLAGDTLTVMGVPVGTGTRIGTDRNLNGILDGDEPAPSLRIVWVNPNTIVAWPTNASGYVLERTVQRPATNWMPDTSLRGLIGSDFTITNLPSPTNLFFRLRGL